jgi:hypothetical protein
MLAISVPSDFVEGKPPARDGAEHKLKAPAVVSLAPIDRDMRSSS